MATPKMREYFKVTEAGASQEELAELQRRLGHELPAAYLSLLRATNGAEWCVHDAGGDCIKIWKAQEVAELYENREVQRYLPDVVAIGSDGGDSAIILDCTASDEPNLWPLFLVDFGALDRDEFIAVAPHFSGWIDREFRLPKRS